MEIEALGPRPGWKGKPRLQTKYQQLGLLISELNRRELPKEIIEQINGILDPVQSLSESDPGFAKLLRKSQSAIVKLLEKELKLVPRNHYRTTWMAVGMSAFGIPIGVAFGAALGNMGLLGAGLPIGFAIGLAVGGAMDNKAKEEGRQLDVLLK